MIVRLNVVFLLVMMPLMSFIPQDEITIFLVGDSTVADKPYKGGNPEKGWGQVFPLYFKEGVRVENHAVNGRSTKSFIDEGRWDTVMSRIEPGDYVIVEFGHNDAKSEDPARYAEADTDYRKNLKKYVTDARAKGAIPVLATPIVRRRFDEKGKFYDTHGRYPEVVREVAKEMNAPLLDLHQRTKELVSTYGEGRSKALFLHITPGEYKSLPEGEKDDTHLSAYGAFKVSDLVVEEMEKAVPKLTSYLKK
jgi:lysophospholipase L1-like esterase